MARGKKRRIRVRADERAAALLCCLAWHYRINNLKERDPDDAIEVPIRALKCAAEVATDLGLGEWS